MIYSCIFHDGLSFLKDAFDYSKVEEKFSFYACSIFFLILFGSVQVLTFLIIFYFSPILYMISEIINSSLLWIIFTIKYQRTTINIIFCSIGNIILLFSSLVYNEIIICNFWDLNINTKKFIEEREKEENKLLNNIQDNDNITDDIESGRNEEDEDDDA